MDEEERDRLSAERYRYLSPDCCEASLRCKIVVVEGGSPDYASASVCK
jgi:hypothetical protein